MSIIGRTIVTFTVCILAGCAGQGIQPQVAARPDPRLAESRQLAAELDDLLSKAAPSCPEADLHYALTTYRRLAPTTGAKPGTALRSQVGARVIGAYKSARAAALSVRDFEVRATPNHQALREDPITFTLFMAGLERRVGGGTLGSPEVTFLSNILMETSPVPLWAKYMAAHGQAKQARQFGLGELCLLKLTVTETRKDDASNADPAIGIDRELAAVYPPNYGRPPHTASEIAQTALETEAEGLRRAKALVNTLTGIVPGI